MPSPARCTRPTTTNPSPNPNPNTKLTRTRTRTPTRYAANYAGAAPAKEKKGGGLFGRGKKAEVPAAPQPDTPKGSQMQWLEAGVDAGARLLD